MSSHNSKPTLVVVVGPTAVGKTELSIRLAESLDGEIISADSRLLYRGMDIGTAKPARAEMQRIKHHLIDVIDPDQEWSLAQFQQAAMEAVADMVARGKLPFMVGGTGQYIRAVVQGWSPPRFAPNHRLRSTLSALSLKRGPYWLHEKLTVLDPAAAEKIDPRNVRRTIRALEVIIGTGRRFSEQGQRKEPGHSSVVVGLHRSRQELYTRIDDRIEAMFTAGFLEEVSGLLAKGYAADLPSMSAIGYRECVEVLKGVISLDEAKRQIRRATRIFVRRQANWFKESDPCIHWFQAGEETFTRVSDFIRASVNIE